MPNTVSKNGSGRPGGSLWLSSIHFKIMAFFLIVGLGLIGLKTNFSSVANFQTPGTTVHQIEQENLHDRPKPFCNRSQIQKGQWIQTNYTNNSNNVSWVNADSCKNKLFMTSSRFTNYEWQPLDHSACQFIEWDKTRFCTLLKGAPIMIVGDSLSFEHFQTMVSALGGKTSRQLQFISFERHMTVVSAVCDHQQTFVMYRRLDLLQHTALEKELTEKFPIVLILNRGAHYKSNDKLSSDLGETFRVVAKWQEQCREVHNVTCHFFWRTTVPGHPNCERFQTPVNDLSRMERLIAAGNYTPRYRWRLFKYQNIVVENLLSSLSSLSHQNNNDSLVDSTILDAYHLNILRPDQHQNPPKDCLHSCLPGKVQVYNRLLLHWLSQSRTMEDVEALEKFSFPWNRTSNIHFVGKRLIVNETTP